MSTPKIKLSKSHDGHANGCCIKKKIEKLKQTMVHEIELNKQWTDFL
jgi:hypothetical protein